MRPVKCGRVFFAIDIQPWEWAERHRLHVKEISLEYNRLKKEILEKEFSRMNEMQKKAVFLILNYIKNCSDRLWKYLDLREGMQHYRQEKQSINS